MIHFLLLSPLALFVGPFSSSSLATTTFNCIRNVICPFVPYRAFSIVKLFILYTVVVFRFQQLQELCILILIPLLVRFGCEKEGGRPGKGLAIKNISLLLSILVVHFDAVDQLRCWYGTEHFIARFQHHPYTSIKCNHQSTRPSEKGTTFVLMFYEACPGG